MMESLLRRSKSVRDTRETRRTVVSNPVPVNSPNPQISSPNPQKSHPPLSSGQKKLGRTTSLRKLARRKSISSTRESFMAFGGLNEHSWKPHSPTSGTITTITAEERKNRASMWFGLVSPQLRAPPSPPEQPKRAPPPPPIRLSPFPPKRVETNVRPSTAGATLGGRDVPFGGTEHVPVGVAIGSPTGTLNILETGKSDYPSLEEITMGGKSPGFRLPDTPFGIEPPKEYKGYMEHHSVPAINDVPPMEPPKTSSWKIKVFAKGMFSRKNTIKSREPTPDIPAMPVSSPNVLTKKKTVHKKKKSDEWKPAPSLDVDIPSIQMERYSVMFGGLLNTSEKGSLYQRRMSKEVSSTEDKSNTLIPEPPLPITHLELPILARRATTPTRNSFCSTPIPPRSPLSKLGDDLRRLSSESRRNSPLPSPRYPSPLPSPGLFRSSTTAADGRPPASPHFTSSLLLPVPSISPPPSLTHSASTSSQTSTESGYFSLATSISSFTLDPTSDPHSHRISRISEESYSPSSTLSTPRGSFEINDDDHWMTSHPGYGYCSSHYEPTWEMITSPINKRFRRDDVSPIDTVELGKAEVGVARQISVGKGSMRVGETSARAAQVVMRREGGRQLGPMKPRLVEHRMSTATTTCSASGATGAAAGSSGARRGQEMVAEVVHAI